MGDSIDGVAKSLGISPQDLLKDLGNGQSIADIAKAKNVDVNTIIETLVDDAKSKIDARGEGRPPLEGPGDQDRVEPQGHDHEDREHVASEGPRATSVRSAATVATASSVPGGFPVVPVAGRFGRLRRSGGRRRRTVPPAAGAVDAVGHDGPRLPLETRGVAMPERTQYAPGTPSWIDLQTSDQAGAKTFYGALFGWDYDDHAGRARRRRQRRVLLDGEEER